MLTRLHRIGLTAAASFAAAVCVPAAATAQTPGLAKSSSSWTANEDDFLFLQLVIENYKLTYDVRGYQTDRGVCLDLADVIQSLDLPMRLDKKSRRATGWLFAEDQKITIDRDAQTVQNVNNGTAPLGSDIYDTPEGWCVDTKALSRWFGIDFKPDLYNSVVRMETDLQMPFMQAIERKSRAARLRNKKPVFDLSKYPHAEMEYRPWRAPSVDVVARAGYNSDTNGGTKLRRRVEVYASGEALGASYDARLATDDRLQPQSLRLRAYRNDPGGNLLGPLKATQVAAGDVETLSGQLTGQTAIGRGAFVSNQPLGRNSRFSSTTLRGTLPAGWDAELYRNGQLIAFQEDSGDGRYEFTDVDLFFGRNELEVVLYGPQGQIRRETTDFPVGFNNIEPGQTYYWAGILQKNRDLIDLSEDRKGEVNDWRWGVGVEHGLDQRTSLAFGIQSLILNNRRRYYAEGAVSRSLGGMLVEFSAAHEKGAGAVTQINAAGRVWGVNYGFNALKTWGKFTSEFVASDLDYRVGMQFDMSLRAGRFVLPIQFAGTRTQLRGGGSVTNILTTTSFAAGPVAFSAQLDHERREGSVNTPDRTQTRVRLLANTRLKDLRIRGNATFDLAGYDRGLESARITVEKPLDDLSDVNGEVEYLARSKDMRFSLGYSKRFERFALRSDASYATNGAFGVNLSLNFSIGPDPVSGGIRFSEQKLARFGQAAVTVFRDDNGDGIRNAGEEVLKAVNVEAGLRRTDAVTGENGTAIVDGLKPFQAVLVGVDESSLGDPFLAPATKGIVVIPRPGVSARIEIPITASGEVEGTLIGLSGVEIPGVLLQLVDRRGVVVAEAMTEFDGFFLFQRVPYGEYRLRVEQLAAKTLQVQQDLAGGVELGRGDDVARIGAIRLRASRPIVAGTDPPAIGGIGAPVLSGGAQAP